jgi:phosphonate transport system permease protein
MNSIQVDEDLVVEPIRLTEGSVKTKAKNSGYLLWVLGIGILIFIFSLLQLNIDYTKIISGTSEFVGMFAKMFPPDASDWLSVVDSAVLTFQMTWVGTLSAAVFSYIIAFFGASNITPNPAVRSVVRGFGALMRAVPVMVWGIIFVAAVGLGPMPGVMALAVHSMGMLIKVFSDSIEEIDEGFIEALKATGANKIQIITRGVIPATFTSSLSWFLLRLDIDLRYSTLLGMVGAGGIGWELVYSMRNYNLNRALFVTLIIFAMLFALEIINNSIKRKIIKV